MNAKTLVFIGMTIGSIVGSCIPYLWGASALSLSSLVLGGVGAVGGVYVGYKISKY